MSLVYFIFFFHDTATTDIYTLSLHDALPIFGYSINAANKFFKSARIYASIQQVYVFTKYWGGPNPETSAQADGQGDGGNLDRKSTRLNSSHGYISYAVFCLKKKKKKSKTEDN